MSREGGGGLLLDRGSGGRRSVGGGGGIFDRIRQYSVKRRKTPVKKEEDEDEEEKEKETSNKKMADNFNNGGRHTLPGPSSSKEPRICIEPRKKRFQPFRVVRKIFRRKSKSSCKEEEEEGLAPNLKSRSTSELLSANCRDVERGVSDVPPYAAGLSLSHDSIFAPESEETDRRRQQKHFVRSPKRFSVKRFKEELMSKFRPRQDSDDDDAGLPRSPCTSPTTVEVLHQGLIGKSEKFRSSDGSLLSMGSSGTDTEDYGGRNLVFDRQPVNSDPDLDIGATLLLDNQAARHRIAVRPRRTRAATLNNRRINRVSTGNGLPTTPEDAEEASAPGETLPRLVKTELPSPPVPPKPSSGKAERPVSLSIQPPKLRSPLAEETAKTEEKVATAPQNRSASESKGSRSKSRAAKQKVQHEIDKFHQRESPERKLQDDGTKDSPSPTDPPVRVPDSTQHVVKSPGETGASSDEALPNGPTESKPKKVLPERSAERTRVHDAKRRQRQIGETDEKNAEDVTKSKSPEIQKIARDEPTNGNNSVENGTDELHESRAESRLKRVSKEETRSKFDVKEESISMRESKTTHGSKKESRSMHESKEESKSILDSKEKSRFKLDLKEESRSTHDLKEEWRSKLDSKEESRFVCELKRESRTTHESKEESKQELIPIRDSKEESRPMRESKGESISMRESKTTHGSKKESRSMHESKEESKSKLDSKGESRATYESKEAENANSAKESAVPDDANKVVITVAQSSKVQVQSEGMSQMRVSPPNRLRNPVNQSHSMRRKSNRIEQISQNLFGNPRDNPEPVFDFVAELRRGSQNGGRAEDPASASEELAAAKSDKCHHHVLYVPAEKSRSAEPKGNRNRLADSDESGLEKVSSGFDPGFAGTSSSPLGRLPGRIANNRIPAVVLPRATEAADPGPDELRPVAGATAAPKKPAAKKADEVPSPEAVKTAGIVHRRTEPGVSSPADETVAPRSKATANRNKRQPINQQLSQEDIDQLEEERQAINSIPPERNAPPSPKARKAVREQIAKPSPVKATNSVSDGGRPERKSTGDLDITIVENPRASPRGGPRRTSSKPEGPTRLPPLEILPYAPPPSPSRNAKTGPGEARKICRVDSNVSTGSSAQAETPPAVPKPIMPKKAEANHAHPSENVLEARNFVPIKLERAEPVGEIKPPAKTPKAENPRLKDEPNSPRIVAVKAEAKPKADSSPTKAEKAEGGPAEPVSKKPAEADRPEENEIQKMLRKLSTKRNSCDKDEAPSAEPAQKATEKPGSRTPAAEAKEFVISPPAVNQAVGGKRPAAVEKKTVGPTHNQQPLAAALQNKPRFTGDFKLEKKPRENDDGGGANKGKTGNDFQNSNFRKTVTTEPVQTGDAVDGKPADDEEKLPPYSRTLRSLKKVSLLQQVAAEPSRKEVEVARLGLQEKEQKIVIEESGGAKKVASETLKRPQSIPLATVGTGSNRPQSIQLATAGTISNRQVTGSAFNGVGRVSAAGWLGRNVKQEPAVDTRAPQRVAAGGPKSPESPKELLAPAGQAGDADDETKPKATATAKFSESGGVEKATEISPGWMKDLKQKNEMKKQQTTTSTSVPQTIIIESKPVPNRSSKVLDMANTFQHRVTS